MNQKKEKMMSENKHPLTNFPFSELSIYEQIVKEFGDDAFTLGEASTFGGKAYPDMAKQRCLYSSREAHDASDFWTFFKSRAKYNRNMVLELLPERNKTK